MIELKGINKIYDTPKGPLYTLKDVDLRVAQGQIVGLIGRSGAGKSTLLRCVNLLERPTSGSVKVDGVELTQLKPQALREARHHIGMVFQHFNLLSTASVFDNVALPLKLISTPKDQVKKRVISILEKVGLAHLSASYPHQLSGGQKQRVAIARALVTEPTVLLCDEMTSALDPETTEEIVQLVRELNAELNLSILCITHSMSVVKAIADQVAVIDDGRIVECNDVVSVFKNPRSSVTERFVQSVLKSVLPEDLQARLQGMPIDDGYVFLRLTFAGQVTMEPVVFEMMKASKASINIIQANIEMLRQEVIGRMVIALDMKKVVLQQIVAQLEMRGLIVEVMGYGHKDWLAS